jgi:peptidoglycan LD-endopeptidase LytH
MRRYGVFGFLGLLALGLVLAVSTGQIESPPSLAPQSAGPNNGALVVPVAGVSAVALTDSWRDLREAGERAHMAIDIAAPKGRPVVAAIAGRVEKLFSSERGGITAYVRSENGRWQTYYAHLEGYAAGLAEGQRVRAGQAIGFVGETGNAGAGNAHLHFAVHRMRPGDTWSGGTPVNPYPLLARNAQAR